MTEVDICAELDALDVVNFEKNRFIPLPMLERLMTREKIVALLGQNNVEFHLRAEATSTILNNGTRLFATLASIRSIKLITRFLETDSFSGAQLDSKLPLSESELLRIIQDANTSIQFFQRQWRFLAPVFHENQCYRELADWAILPFLRRRKIGQGGFSVVYKVTVDASHHRIAGTNGELDLVCKQLSMGDNDKAMRAAFEHEVQMLSSLRCLNHPNIIRLITAYAKGDDYNFLLPVADHDLSALLLSPYCGNLFSTRDDVLGALWGLSSALEAVHMFFADEYNIRKVGCHYDIKPQNILCIGGKLVLSDFGLSRLRPEEEGSRSLFKRGEGSYIAPECEPSDEDFKPGKIGRSSDIWSLGCVLCEVLVYLSAEPGDGPGAVQEFRKSRRIQLGPSTSYHFHSVDGVNPAVVDFLNNYAGSPSSPSHFKSLALLIRDILQFDPDMRPTAFTVTRRLFSINQQNVWNEACLVLEKFLISTDIELLIELWRLKIWGKTVGLSCEIHEIQHPALLTQSHNSQEYLMVQEILQQCLVESQNIVAQLHRDRNPPYQLSHSLQRLLDSLWNMQPCDVRRSMTSQLEESMLNLKNIPGLPSMDEQIVSSSLTTRHGDYRRVAYLATMKKVALLISQQSSFDQDLSMDKLTLEPPTTKLHTHLLMTLHGKGVLIEIMEYQDAWLSRVPELITRVRSIAYLLNRRSVDEKIFPVLRCIGYYHDVPYPQFGIVYQLPDLARNTKPMSLNQIIHGTQSRTRQPSLTRKFDLAFSLVSHILDFHLGGWLHKSISSFNIICFPEVFNDPAQSLSSPYFIGFNRCRLNNETAFTVPSGPDLEYQHPAYIENSKKSFSDAENRRPRFQQEFDYYSVGLVLMEIAFWKPLKEITQKISGSPEELVAHLLKTHIPLVKTYMGDSYGDAIRFCLTCYGDADGCAEVAGREGFRSNVVLPIQKRSV